MNSSVDVGIVIPVIVSNHIDHLAFELTVVADDEAEAQEYIATAKNEIERIELLISSWDSNSETSSINQNAWV